MMMNIVWTFLIDKRKVSISQILGRIHFIHRLNLETRRKVWPLMLVWHRECNKISIDEELERCKMRLKKDLNDFPYQQLKDLHQNNKKRLLIGLKSTKKKEMWECEKNDLK